MVEEIRTKFKELFNKEPVTVRSPGRVNLIGEHTDYNNGFVLPAAVNKEIYFAIAPNNTEGVNFYSFDLKQQASFNLQDLKPSKLGWANYLLGVIAQFQKAGYTLRGFDLVFGGNIPIGAGLSSSAAMECGLAFALSHLFNLKVDKLTIARMSQKAEHEYAGVMCGIMDQFASVFGKQDHAIKLDCRSLDYEYYKLDLKDYRIALCDTQVKHSLASSEYNTRRQECEAGVAILQKYYPNVRSLRDTTLAMLEQHRDEFDSVIYKRCSYVVSENNRVEEACAALKSGDLKLFGDKMYASHQGLQHDYEVSCPELDFLVHQARNTDAVLGARMMGGGFGGCTINIVSQNELDTFTHNMEEAYKQQFNIQLKTYIAEIVDGSSLYPSLHAGTTEEN